MTNKKKSPSPKNNESQSYIGVAIVFFVVGITMIVSESTRAVGLPFVILGITFFIISQGQSTNNKK